MKTEIFASESSRWQAVIQRNPLAEGKFVYGVVSTGIYCRPTCSSRKPNQANVRFFDNWQTAGKAGFRPCKRCAPQAPAAPNPAVDLVVRACRIIEESEQAPSLNQLADAVGLSACHFQRLFKKTVGVTPKHYAMEKRLTRIRVNLRQNTTVTDAIYKAGYESSSRFYETATKSLGMTPSEYQKGGKGKSIRYAVFQFYLGWVLIAVTEQGVCKIDFGNTPEILHTKLRADFPEAKLQVGDPAFKSTLSQILPFLEAPEHGLTLPLDIQGTAFQRQVWAALQTIPAGSTATYAEIAKRIGRPKAARAVAQACAANKIAVAIPCHRVVRSDGDLGGYRWGIERKQAILERESCAPPCRGATALI
ncbi:MAG: bifunctional DNA-binding transcriptional regulator/O6-methylguanine-DNA methyltransferase Ada [Thermodesulfobacteriota bacterium]